MLVTSRTRHTYGFIDDDRIVVTRPAMMSEVQALRALRTGDAAPFLAARVALHLTQPACSAHKNKSESSVYTRLKPLISNG